MKANKKRASVWEAKQIETKSSLSNEYYPHYTCLPARNNRKDETIKISKEKMLKMNVPLMRTHQLVGKRKE